MQKITLPFFRLIGVALILISTAALVSRFLSAVYLGTPYPPELDLELISIIPPIIISGLALILFTIDINSVFYFINRMIGLVVFSISLYFLTVSVFFPSTIINQNLEHAKDVQIFLSVGSSGTLGGVMRYLTKENQSKTEGFKLWEFIKSSITGLFVAIVLFLTMRAGLINKVSLDTFNIYGVSGLSSVAGFFSNRMIKKFTSVFDGFIENDKNRLETKNEHE